MFPTFISILDIQSWWEVPSIAHFCSLFRTAFNLLDFDIEDLEEALLTDGTEETSWLQELIVRLLSGCLPHNEISTFNYQMFLRRLFRQKCQEHDQYNPFNTDIDFQLLPLRTKVDILYALCDFRLDANDVLDRLKNLEADSLRVEPLGYDNNQSAYWYFYGTRLYREDIKKKNNKKEKSIWQVICFTEDDWFQLAKKFKKSYSKVEKQLHNTLTENFLPELPRLFHEKERLARKRLLQNFEKRTSHRLRKQEIAQKEQEQESAQKERLETELQKERLQKKIEDHRRAACERRAKLREQSVGSQSENSVDRYEMAGAKTRDRKSNTRQRQNSESSTSSKDRGPVLLNSSCASGRNNVQTDGRTSTSTSNTTTVGRQTNNSLACATGQIVIQPVSNPHRKKLKTSQVFRQTDEDLQTGMHKILDHVKNHDDAWPFIDPVEEEYAPNYYSVIRKPMDLQRMEERLDAGHYKTFTRFRADFQLIVDNCRLYNGADNEYTEMVDNLLKVFERATERYLDEITSTDEEIAVEYPDLNKDVKMTNKRKKSECIPGSKRKPSLAAQTDNKKERSLSNESTSQMSDSLESDGKIVTKKKQTKKEIHTDDILQNNNKQSKKTKIKIGKLEKNTSTKKKDRKHVKTKKPHRVSPTLNPSPVRSRSFSRSPSRDRWTSSPPPSWPPSSPESRFEFSSKKNHKKDLFELSDEEKSSKTKAKHDKWKETYKDKSTVKNLIENERSQSPPKYKDKHNKLRETIEKLKAKSEIANKFKEKDAIELDTDKMKENMESPAENQPNKIKKSDTNKYKQKLVKNIKCDTDFDDGNSTIDSVQSENKKQDKKNANNNMHSKNAAIEALTLATEQTLKDINKWLDDTKFSEFSSASNSPSHISSLDDFDTIGNKVDADFRKKADRPVPRKDGSKEVKRRPFRDPTKLFRRREIQRTIDRLQPGKSKGNLISNIQNTNKPDELYPLGPLSKTKDTKNSLIVKTNESTPKLSLGSVLDSFGKHKFVDDCKKEDDKDCVKKKDAVLAENAVEHGEKKKPILNVKTEVPGKKSAPEPVNFGKPTPNLSAWFKAFGAPKVQPPQKKCDKTDIKENEKSDETTKAQDLKKADAKNVTPIPDPSASPDSPVMQHGQPTPRQRKISTGSSMSERSSFSQDMDSPRVGIDERLGAYPAPYPSPLHKSPSGASPIMASPRPDVSPKAASYPTFNGQIRVGFYQDTVSNKSSPDKSCSPRETTQSTYSHYSEHVYTPPTTQNTTTYSYNNAPYYSQTPSYSTSNPTPPYNMEQNNSPSYYDTNKPLTDQYQAKVTPNYANSHIPNTQLPSPNTQQPSPVLHQHSPNVEVYRQDQLNKASDKPQNATMFPVKKRVYNDNDSLLLHPNHYDLHKNISQEQFLARNIEMGLLTGRQVNLERNQNSPGQNLTPVTKETTKSYVHQNIPDPRAPLAEVENSQQVNSNRGQSLQNSEDSLNTLRSISYSTPNNTYNYSTEAGYQLNIPSTRSLESERSIDIAKYNIGFTGADMGFSRTTQYNRSEISYPRSISTTASPQTMTQTTNIESQNLQSNNLAIRYSDPNVLNMGYKGISVNSANTFQQSQLSTLNSSSVLQKCSENAVNRLAQTLEVPSGYKPSDRSISRPSYSTPSALDMDQSLNLRGNLSHIVDRYQSDERLLGLQTPTSYYADKTLASPHMFSKPMAANSSGLPMFSQSNMAMPYSSIQATSPMYNRQMTDLQNANMMAQDKTNPIQQPTLEKKSKRRKTNKTATPPTSIVETASSTTTPNQGFQSYVGLKSSSSMEPSAISLKTASVVPGSAFNFGPTPTGLGLSTGLYGDKDAYPNFLDEFRAAPNYYMAAAAAAHHRSTPDATDKSVRPTHQSTTVQTPGYPFIGGPQPRPPSYPLSGTFMSPHQTPLMDTSAPIYQQYLQAGVLHQSFLGSHGAYPPGYHHPALSMRQPYDSMTRPSWL